MYTLHMYRVNEKLITFMEKCAMSNLNPLNE